MVPLEEREGGAIWIQYQEGSESKSPIDVCEMVGNTGTLRRLVEPTTRPKIHSLSRYSEHPEVDSNTLEHG